MIRQWARRALRASEQVSDARGSLFPGGGFRGDYQEDPQLEAAIRRIMLEAGVEVLASEYQAAFGAQGETAIAGESEANTKENG